MEVYITTTPIALQKKGGTFAQRKISKTLRDDYDKYLMGQTRITFVAKLRRKTEYEVTRIFNILYHEKRTAYQKLQQ